MRSELYNIKKKKIKGIIFKHAKTKRSAKDSGARGSNDPAPRTKRTVRDLEGPTSPETIRKAARINWKKLQLRMITHSAS